MDNVLLKIEGFAYDVIYFVLWIIEVLLALRFILKILGANPANGLIQFVYSTSLIFMGPFYGIFGSSSISNMTLEPSVLVAMIFYALVAYLLVSLVKLLSGARREDSVNRPM